MRKNSKYLFIIIGICAVVFICSIVAFLPTPTPNVAHGKSWLSKVSDDTKLTDLSLPGTHDSGAEHSLYDIAGKCQDLDISQQLAIGVRFLDIRLQLRNDKLFIVHSFVDQGIKFSTILRQIQNFLLENSSEFLIVSIKQDADTINSTITFTQAVKKELTPATDLIDYRSSLPNTVGQIRGKMIILARYENNTIGIPAFNGWQDSTTFELGNFLIQYNYKINDVNTKKIDIKKTLDATQNTNDKLVLNFSSCYLTNAFPPTYAGTCAKNINPWLLDVIRSHPKKTGVIVADFITAELCKTIFERNYL